MSRQPSHPWKDNLYDNGFKLNGRTNSGVLFNFKIEYSFKELKHSIGAFCYRFWIMGMRKTRRSEGDRYIHREPQELKHKISIKMFAYHLYIQIAIIAQGLCQYLSLYHSDEVWRYFVDISNRAGAQTNG